MVTEIGILILGVPPGWLLRDNARAVAAVGGATTATIYALLFTLGVRLGADEVLLRAIHILGFQGLVLGICCTMGSAACVMVLERFFRLDREERRGRAETDAFRQGMKATLKIFACFCTGILLGVTGLLPQWFHGGGIFMGILWTMLFCVGMGMGFELHAFLLVGDMGFRVILLPLLSLTGTALGAALAFCLLADLDLRSCLAVGAGMGYYSLSTAIVTEFGSPALASVTLIANVFRELFILLATPLLTRLMGPLAPVAGAGAPGVDVCLPTIMRFCGERYGVLAVFNGLVLTMLVPFILPFVLTVGK